MIPAIPFPSFSALALDLVYPPIPCFNVALAPFALTETRISARWNDRLYRGPTCSRPVGQWPMDFPSIIGAVAIKSERWPRAFAEASIGPATHHPCRRPSAFVPPLPPCGHPGPDAVCARFATGSNPADGPATRLRHTASAPGYRRPDVSGCRWHGPANQSTNLSVAATGSYDRALSRPSPSTPTATGQNLRSAAAAT